MELSQQEINQKLTERGFKVKPVNKLALSVKDLTKDLESLEALYKLPRLYLTEWYTQLRSEIDLAVEKQSYIITTNEIKEKLKANYLSMIEKIKLYEDECLKHRKTNAFEATVSEDTEKAILKIKERIDFLDNAVKDGKGEPIFDVNGDPEEDSNEFCDEIGEIDDAIYDQKFKLEKVLMLNRTILFLQESDCLADANKVFSRMDYLTTAGKLFIISDDYFGKRSLNSITSKISIDASYMQRLTNEIVKSMHFKKHIEQNPSSEQIEEMPFPSSDYNLLEIINRQIRTLHPDMFQGLSKMKKIDLNFNIINIIDENLFRGLSELEELILLKNKIDFLPPTCLRDLKSLKMITLRENYLKSLDERTFEGLVNLQIIYFFYNRLKSIPANLFQGLTSLREIYLGGNFITRLDSKLFKGLKNLRELYLSHNQIEGIEDDLFSDLDNLTCLMLNNNRIKLLTGKMLSGLKSLEKMWINDNMLKSVESDLILKVPSLTAIYLYNNDLPKEQSRAEFFKVEPGRNIMIDF